MYVYIYIHFFWTKVFAYFRVKCHMHGSCVLMRHVTYILSMMYRKKRIRSKQVEERKKNSVDDVPHDHACECVMSRFF